MVNWAFARVDILHHFAAGLHGASAAPHHLTADAVNRKHNSSAEKILRLSVSCSGETRGFEIPELIAFFDGRFTKCISRIRAISELKLVDCFGVEAALPEVIESDALAFVGFFDLLRK